jgi:phosphoribosyl 1,2-cyclic phosphodiesterase
VADLAHAANVKTLYLFHHDPDQDDAEIDNKFDLAKEYLSKKNSPVEVLSPREGDRFKV